jgi:hypothetical protein
MGDQRGKQGAHRLQSFASQGGLICIVKSVNFLKTKSL